MDPAIAVPQFYSPSYISDSTVHRHESNALQKHRVHVDNKAMDTCDNNIVGAFELRMIDADIAHIRLAIEAVLHESNSALPMLYWRRRLEHLLRSRHLLHHQFSAVADLLTRIEKISEAERDDAPTAIGRASSSLARAIAR